MILLVVIHLGLTAASEHNAPDETPAGILPSPAEYISLRVSAGAGDPSMCMRPLASRRAGEPRSK